MSLLTMIQGASDALELQRPTAVITDTSQTTRHLLALAQREGYDLARRGPWKVLTKEATFSTVAALLQGTVSSLIGSDVQSILPETVWNRDRDLRLADAMTPQDWQWTRGQDLTNTFESYRVRGDSFYIDPIPTAGQTIALEYISKNWCQSSGGTEQQAWAADSDTGILDETLMQLGIIWRWKQAAGVDYSEEFRLYEEWVSNALAREGGKAVLSMTGVGPFHNRLHLRGVIVN